MTSRPVDVGAGRRSTRTFVAALFLTCLPALLGIPAAWLDLRRNPYPDGYGERLLGLEVAIAVAALVVLGVGLATARAGRRRAPVGLLAAAWAGALLFVEPAILSPQLTVALLCQLAMVVFLLAHAVRTSRLLLGFQLSFLAGSGAFLLAELTVGVLREGRESDYGDLGVAGDRFSPGGQLKPDLDLEVIGDGPGGRVRFVTSSAGFRNRGDQAPIPADSTTRILFAGDSFFAGYRVDQDDMAGAALERRLNDAATGGRRFEVLVARVDDPARCWLWLVEHGLSFHPDLVVAGVTLGNDVGDCWLALHPDGRLAVNSNGATPRIERNPDPGPIGFRTPPLSEDLLPDDAFRRHANPLVDRAAPHLRALRGKLARLKSLALLGSAAERRGIASWYSDAPRRVHTFDLVHGLGAYYGRSPLPTVDQGFERLETALLGIHAACSEAGVRLLVALVPQRFEIDDREWAAATDQYGLDPHAFDLARPARRLGRFLGEHAVEHLDLATALRREAPNARLYLPRGDMHWNRAGHRVAGEALATALRDLLDRER